MSFLEIITKTIDSFCKSLKHSWILIISIGTINFLYPYLISTLMSDIPKIQLSILLYNLLVYPIIVIIIMYIIREEITYNNLLKNTKKLLQDTQRCYSRFLIYYLILTLFKVFFSHSTNLLLYLIIIIKFPFIESFVFFNNESLWKSTIKSFKITQNKVIKITLLLAVCLLLSYLTLIKTTQAITAIPTIKQHLFFIIGLIASNVEILGKVLVISLFRTIPHNIKSDNSI